MIKAVFFDIDGTLIPLGKDYLPESTKTALNALHEKGIRLFIASGRPPKHIEHICDDLKNFSWDGYVLFNGQYCCDGNKNVFHQEHFTQKAMEEIVPYIKENHIPVVFFELEHGYKNMELPSMMGPKVEIEDCSRALTHDTYQLGVYIKPEEDAEFVSHSSGIKAARWTDVFADVIPVSGGKPEGMQRTMDRYGIKREECMAFGDGGNDITMLEYAAIGVAMGNAKDEVKAHADYVTSHVEQDGIYNALKHFNII